jgi:hypothetical protein
MNQFCETLELRTLFSTSTTVPQQLAVIDGAIATLEGDFAANAATYKAGTTAIDADIKVLPRNRTNKIDEVKLTAAVAVSTALDDAFVARYYAALRVDIPRVRAAAAADLAKPTMARNTALARTIALLETASAAAEARALSTISLGDTRITNAEDVLVAANPTAATLAADITASQTAHVAGLNTDTSQFAVIELDINAVTGATA